VISCDELANCNGMRQPERDLGGAPDQIEAQNENTPASAGDGPRRGVGMSVDEQQVNEALRALDEAHRLQRIQRNEYRQRRRALLESLIRVTAGAGDSERRVSDGTRSAEGAAPRPGFGIRLLAACALLLCVVAGSTVLFCWSAIAR
jgi:hypothetical protein